MAQYTPLDEETRNKGLLYNLIDGGFANVMGSLCGGVFITGFALLLGASDLQMGLLASLPMLANMAQPVGSYLVERFHYRRPLTLLLLGSARSLWFLIILLPYFHYNRGPSAPALYVLIIVATASALLSAFGMLAWTSWMGDLVPAKRRGRYFGLRNTIAGAAGTTAILLGSFYIDHWKKVFGDDDPVGFFVIFGVGMIAGLLSMVMLQGVPEEKPASGEPTPYLSMLREVLAEVNFRRFILFRTFFGFGVSFMGPFFTVYMLKNMGLSYGLIAVFTALNSLFNVAGMYFWGRLGDHFGNRPVIISGVLGAGLLGLIWLPTAGGLIWVIPVGYIIGGLAWAAVNLSEFNMLLKLTPEEHKSVYIATYNASMGTAYVLGPVAGGLLAQALGAWEWQVGSFVFVNYHVLMLVSSVLRLSSVFLLRRVHEPKAAKVSRMVRVLWHTRSLNPLRFIRYHYHVLSSHDNEKKDRP